MRKCGSIPPHQLHLSLLVTVKSEQGVEIHNVPMLIDTGADVSLLPRPLVESLASPDDKQYDLEAFDGTKSKAAAINVEVQFLVIDSWHGILGRNILNNLALLLDGPSRKWMERR